MTDDEKKNFVAKDFSEYFKYTGEKLYYNLNDEQYLWNVAESF